MANRSEDDSTRGSELELYWEEQGGTEFVPASRTNVDDFVNVGTFLLLFVSSFIHLYLPRLRSS